MKIEGYLIEISIIINKNKDIITLILGGPTITL